MTLRATFYDRLNDSLSKFGPTLLKEDFSINVDQPKLDISQEPHDFELCVTYNYDSDYYFHYIFSVQRDGTYMGSITMVPGQHVMVDRFEANMRLDVLIGYIDIWGSSLREEILTLPTKRRFEEHQRLIDSLMDQFQGLPDEYFTRAEAEEMRSKLDELESLFAAHVNTSTADSVEKEKKLEQIHQEIEALKAQLDVLKKQGFFKRLYLRLSGVLDYETTKKLAGDSAEILGKFTSGAIKGYIGDGNGDGPSE